MKEELVVGCSFVELSLCCLRHPLTRGATMGGDIPRRTPDSLVFGYLSKYVFCVLTVNGRTTARGGGLTRATRALSMAHELTETTSMS